MATQKEVERKLIGRLVGKAIKNSTRRQYQSALRMYREKFKLPAKPAEIVEYIETATVSRRNKDGSITTTKDALSIQSCGTVIAALSWWHKSKGLDDPTANPLVGILMDNIRRTRSRPIDQAKPVSLNDLHKICDAIDTETFGEKSNRLKATRDKAMILTLFYGGLRVSECLALETNDIEIEPAGAIITIRHSKTDPGLGAKIPIPRTRENHCPVNAMESWLETAKLRGGKIFRMIDADGKITKKQVMYNYARTRISRFAEVAGLDSAKIKTHGMRAGVLTELAGKGIDIAAIAKLARHKSTATTMRYIRPSDEKLLENAPTRRLQEQPQEPKKPPRWKRWLRLA